MDIDVKSGAQYVNQVHDGHSINISTKLSIISSDGKYLTNNDASFQILVT